jgi:SAM-dependent methyltransferase
VKGSRSLVSVRSARDRTREVYDRETEVCLRRWIRRTYRRPPLLQELLQGLPAGALILDLGCGPAQDTRDLGRHGYRVVGLDLSLAFLAHARRRHRRLPLVLADIASLPFRRQVFNGIWAAASLIHLPKPAMRRALAALSRLTAQGGWLAATLAQGRTSSVVTRGWLPGRFIARWQKEELAGVVRSAGWKVVSLKAVSNRERKGRWLVVTARAQSGGRPSEPSKREIK